MQNMHVKDKVCLKKTEVVKVKFLILNIFELLKVFQLYKHLQFYEIFVLYLHNTLFVILFYYAMRPLLILCSALKTVAAISLTDVDCCDVCKC